MAVLLQDSFDRANSATDPGSPEVGGPYTVGIGYWGISGNQLYTWNAVNLSVLFAPGAVDVDFSAQSMIISTNKDCGLVWRATDANNHWAFSLNSGGWNLMRKIAGSYYLLGNTPGSAGDTARVVALGRQMYLLVNGVCRFVIEDSWYGNGASQIGYLMHVSSALRIDNALAQDATGPPGAWGTTEVADPALGDSTLNLSPSLYKGRDTKTADEGALA